MQRSFLKLVDGGPGNEVVCLGRGPGRDVPPSGKIEIVRRIGRLFDMDELGSALRLNVTGSLRETALAGCARQLASWGLVMPSVEPLVLDFGLGDFYTTGLIEYWIANEVEAGYCGKFLFLFDGQVCPRHHHEEKLETFFIQRGSVRMQHEGREWIMQAGDVLRMEIGQPHQFGGAGPALILEVSRPSVIADNYFADHRIPIGGNHRPS